MAEKQELTLDEYRKRSRRSFLTGGAAALVGFAGWRGVQSGAPNSRDLGVLRDPANVWAAPSASGMVRSSS